MKRRKAGSITVFMSLMLMVIGSLLFTLLEGSRFLMLEMTARMNSQSVTESMFAEYHVPAYQKYHLLMMDSSYGTGQLMLSKVNQKMQELGQENLNPVITGFGRYNNFLQMNATGSSVIRYELATDQHAMPLLKQISQMMKTELAADLVEGAYKKVTDIHESGRQGEKADQYLHGALDTIEQAKEAAKEENGRIRQQSADRFLQSTNFHAQTMQRNTMETFHVQTMQKTSMGTFHAQTMQKTSMGTVSGILRTDTGWEDSDFVKSDIENPMEDIKSAKNSPLLAQILSGEHGISSKQISKEDSVEKRILNTGNYGSEGSAGIADKILIMQYLKKYTSNFQHKIPGSHALAYEQEYILYGKDSDEENLKKMASRLLLIREGINFAYLLTDTAKCEEAFAVAATVAAAVQIPAAVKAIQMGILASWSYAESIAELRTLFTGGKIAVVKTADSWTVSLAEAASVPFRNSVKSKEVSHGLDYEDFLQSFLALESLDKIGMRFANLLEKNMQLYAGYEQTRLDCMITAMEANHEYHANQVFLTFVTVTRLSKKGYRYEQKYKFSYLDEKEKEKSY